MLQRLPGQRTRADIKASLVPSLRAFIHAGMRLSYGVPFLIAGYPQLAMVFAIMAAMILFGNVEGRITQAISDGVDRVRGVPVKTKDLIE